MPGKSPGPSVKNEEQYEKLREKGMSKEKAARIANAPTSKTGARGGRSPRYEEWSKEELYDKANGGEFRSVERLTNYIENNYGEI